MNRKKLFENVTLYVKTAATVAISGNYGTMLKAKTWCKISISSEES